MKRRQLYDINLLPRRERPGWFTRLILPIVLTLLVLAGGVYAGIYFPELWLDEKQTRLDDLRRLASLSADDAARFDEINGEVSQLAEEGGFIARYTSNICVMLPVLREMENLRPVGVTYSSIVSDGETLLLDGTLSGGPAGLTAGSQLIVNLSGSPLFANPLIDVTETSVADGAQAFHLILTLTGSPGADSTILPQEVGA